MNKLSVVVMGMLLSGCGMGSVHPGDKSRISTAGATGCDSEEAFSKLDIYVNKDNDTNRANRELFYPGHCKGFKKDEVVNVIQEHGDLRKVRRADGTELWTSWVWLGVVI
jgi:hypothetical protein